MNIQIPESEQIKSRSYNIILMSLSFLLAVVGIIILYTAYVPTANAASIVDAAVPTPNQLKLITEYHGVSVYEYTSTNDKTCVIVTRATKELEISCN